MVAALLSILPESSKRNQRPEPDAPPSKFFKNFKGCSGAQFNQLDV
jgi:hypothetical protein